jgi:hypothetical protein
MAEPINLNQARKARAKAEAKTRAARNRVRFGQPKDQRAAQDALREKAAKALDDAKRGPHG